MSSHHFVIEGQEPALIIGNGEMCSITLLTQLLEWCPFVVALDGACNRLNNLQIKPDVVIGDFDSISDDVIDKDITTIKVDNQGNTDLEKALDYLVQKGYTDINLAWTIGKRLDHTLNNISSIVKYPELNICLYNDYSKAFLLKQGFKKYYNKGQKISLLPSPETHNVNTTNLKYNLNNINLRFGVQTSSSNEVLENGIVSVDFEKGNLLLIESND